MTWISHWGSGYYSDVMDRFGEAQINNAGLIFAYLYKNGFVRNAIMAILGNMMTESYLNPGQWQHGYNPYDGNPSNGMGFVGWTPYWRITDWLESRGYDLSDPESYAYGMLDKLIEECFNPQEVTWIATDSYPISFSEFASDTTHSIEWLANAFLYNYERPAVTPQPARAEQAKKWSEILPEVPGGTYTPRLSIYEPSDMSDSGSEANRYYFTENLYYRYGFGIANCTAYAAGRWFEITGEYPDFTAGTGNANRWYADAIAKGYEAGQEPRLGAIACFGYEPGGHVAVVEQINDDGSFVTSNSAWNSDGEMNLSPGQMFNSFPCFYLQTYHGTPGNQFQGFVYPPDAYIPPKPPEKVAFKRWIPA